MPALSIATSVPVPIAMPTVACASAGASLMPSPAIATRCPPPLQLLDDAPLAVGQHLGADVVDAEARRRSRAAVMRLSPVSITRRRPSAFEQLDGLGRGRPNRIGDGDQAGRAIVDRDEEDGLPVLAQARRRARPARPDRSDATRADRACRDRRAVPRRVRSRRDPVVAAKSVAGGIAIARASAALTIAAASGCSLPRSTAAASRSSSCSLGPPAAASIAVTSGRPSVSVPVLSIDQRVDAAEQLERFGVLDEHAGARALPGADHDRHRRREPERARARDDQHGDRVDERVREARLRSPEAPRREGEDGGGHDGRHEVRRDAIGEPLNRRARALRLARPCARSARAACRGRRARRAS